MAVAGKNILKAIGDLYDGAGGASLRALVNALHYDQAPQSSSLPYIVFHIINMSPGRTFSASELREDMLLQFSIFDETRNVDAVWNIYDALDALYDEATITVTGYTSIAILRESVVSPVWLDKTWQMSADYRWEIQKS